ncbi:MAG: hypothetical protein M3O71_31740 [Bacteroidota bacterium]|nr:hypothetical protein [Bacteroidota bacterium]
MLFKSFIYSLKVWLTSVAITPLVFSILAYSGGNVLNDSVYEQINRAAYQYGMILVFELLFSFITWVIFLIIIQLTVTYFKQRITRLTIISISGVLLAMGTFMVILTPVDAFNVTRGFGGLTLCTCFCIAAGSWFYKLEPSPKTLTEFNENIV